MTGLDVRKILGKITAATPTNITAASNASPIQVTSAAHGLQTGDKAVVQSVAGNTAANGIFSVTRVDANNVTLDGSTGNGAYTAGGTITRVYSAITQADLETLDDARNRLQQNPTGLLQALESIPNL